MNKPSFEECFCQKHHIEPADFSRLVMRKTLPLPARFLRWILPIIAPQYFTADFDLISGVASLRRLRDFEVEAVRYHEHWANQGWLRKKLGMRVSVRRLRRLVKETLPANPKHEPAGTRAGSNTL